MIPLADIVAVNANTSYEELLNILAEKTYSRLPVYKDSLDNVIGSIHVKDILSALASGKTVEIPALVRDIQIISPSLNVLDLLLQMRLTGKHMVLVIDEYGGIDGLVTIGDVIEAVVGEIDDEHDPDEEPEVQIRPDGTVIADARLDLEDFEEGFGIELDEEEKEENDTLGGLIFSIAGRVPVRGEVIPHDSGIVFEILEADPRRVRRVCIRNIPKSALQNSDSE
jgi:magnesium and cobalt transporter